MPLLNSTVTRLRYSFAYPLRLKSTNRFPAPGAIVILHEVIPKPAGCPTSRFCSIGPLTRCPLFPESCPLRAPRLRAAVVGARDTRARAKPHRLPRFSVVVGASLQRAQAEGRILPL